MSIIKGKKVGEVSMVYDMILFKTTDEDIRKNKIRKKFKNDEEVFKYFNEWFNEYINHFCIDDGKKALKYYLYLVDNFPNSKYILICYRGIKKVPFWYNVYVKYQKRIKNQ